MTNAVVNVCVGLHLLMWLGTMLLVRRAAWLDSRAEQVGQQAGCHAAGMQGCMAGQPCRAGGAAGWVPCCWYAGLAGQPCRAGGAAGWYDKAVHNFSGSWQ